MTVHGRINGQPAQEALKDLRCVLCKAPIGLNEIKKLYFKNLFRSPTLALREKIEKLFIY